jgi:polar amino acid transport system permease protein
MNTFQILYKYRGDFLVGLTVTLKLCLLVWGIGLLFGILLGFAGSKFKNAVGLPSRIFSFLLGGIPVLVFLFWLHYPVQFWLGVVIDGFYTAVAALAIINTFLVADIVRSALNNFPSQYILAAEVCGLDRNTIYKKIQLPIILRQILPSIIFTQVAMLQSTLFASLISVEEIFRVCQRINSSIYKPVEIYSSLAILFLLICLPINGIGYWIKRKYTRDLSET